MSNALRESQIRGGGKPSRKLNGGPPLPRYDQALNAAKNAGKTVRIHLAVDTAFCEEDGVVVGTVLEVDKYDVKMHVPRTENLEAIDVWIRKSMIVGTEIL